ncbi:hypothetical protein M2138_000176 [Dysgonomonadaceae bacterium PH5-43]|nr:hypothetical protein [Dysgonomonadaceae bacterium PH5-43]
MTVTLYPGKYRFVCSCEKGHLYEDFEVKKKQNKMENYCWYCKGNGKFIKIMEEYLDFSNNWNNKLNCDAFSTLRLRNDKKYFIGAEKSIILKGTLKGQATIVGISYFTIDKINESIARLDTGYSAEKCRDIIKTMYKNKRIDWSTQQLAFCILAYEKPIKNDLFDEV